MKIKALLGVSALIMVAALYMVFIYVPTDVETGIIQRIFYFHVPLAWVAFLAFFVVFTGSILYLWKRDNKWDFVSSSSAEVGLVFTTLFPHHRLYLGQASLGSLVDLGLASYLIACPVAHLFSLFHSPRLHC